MLIGYCRVSTRDQDLTRQIESLKEYGCEKIYSDKATGKNFNRPEYTKLKDALRKGDTLVVHEFDRLGRNKKLTLKELQYFKDNGIRLVALNLPTTQMDTKDNLMLETINNIVIELYTMMAQQEIETREKRQREGIDIALANGVKFGRKEVEYPKNWESVIQLVDNKQLSNLEAMTMLGLKKTTYYKLLKEYKSN
ncbi:MAG: recombinase family protein, partial [Peptostreptococcaceae bacterium]|nr:recombinase family protein [Peptostreptococcaceae bacterium]